MLNSKLALTLVIAPDNNNYGIKRTSHKPVYKISVGVKSKQFLPSSQLARGHCKEGEGGAYVYVCQCVGDQ